MKALLTLCLVALLAAVTSAHKGSLGTSPWGYISIMKGCTYNGMTKQHGTFFLNTDGINWCFCYDGKYECTTDSDTLSYNYRDEVAQTYCASKKETEHVFAVRRDCGNSADPYTCNDICNTTSVFNTNLTSLLPGVAGLGDTYCYDGLWFWMNHPKLELNPGSSQPDAGQINMGTYGYGSGACTWTAGHCGPNYCCCGTAGK